MFEMVKRMTNGKVMRMIGLSFIIFHLSFSLCACSEDDATTDEFANWRERNDATTDQWAASGMKRIRTFTQDDTSTGKSSDYIYVEVLEAGDGTESPLYTDTVRVAYRGRLIPTTNYANGFVFDETYVGDFSWHTAGVATMAISGTKSSLVNGFATALMNMHKGDRWLVHIPYQLGYNATSSGSVTAYSNLTFDIALLDYWGAGDPHPAFRARWR
jgi:FKBP-type peptidyl-prolyl cis-trans isomerase FklB